jgi:phage terminase large subunit
VKVSAQPPKQQPWELNATFPAAFQDLFIPSRYKVFHGGRGSAKSHSFAGALVMKASMDKLGVLCAREFQNSIADSVHKLLVSKIHEYKLNACYDITDKCITSSVGSEFIFKGLHKNVDAVRSTEDVDICWVEEAQRVSSDSWKVLIPTIRKPRSEIWVSFNADGQNDPTYQRFVVNPPPGAVVRKVNYDQNPFFPEVLRAEMEYDKRNDYEAYLWVWEGNPRHMSNAIIFGNKFRVESFETPADAEFRHGADWGFSQDPTVLTRSFIRDNKLYIDQEAYGVGVELNEIPQLFDSIKTARKWAIKADNARPETISHVAALGFNISAADKWNGSVEDGIAYLKKFEEIVIHERCVHTATEAKLYSYKVDRLTGEVLPIIVDKHNHCWDSVRYAHDDLIQSKNLGMLEFYRQQAMAAEQARHSREEMRT